MLEFDRLWNSMSPSEKKQAAFYVAEDKVQDSFVKVEAKVKEGRTAFENTYEKAKDMLQSTPEIQKSVLEQLGGTISLLEDVPEELQEDLSKQYLQSIKHFTNYVGYIPLLTRLRNITVEHEATIKSANLKEHEKKIEAMDRRIERSERDLQDETDEDERVNIEKRLTKAKQEKLNYQEKRNETIVLKSVAKKRSASDLWNKANPRAMKFHRAIQKRGLNVKEPEEEEEENMDGGTYADAVKKTTEKSFLAKLFGYK